MVVYLFLSFLFMVAQAPLPDKLMSAQTAYLENMGVSAKMFDNLWQAVNKWKRYSVVTDKGKADIVISLSTQPTGDSTVVFVPGTLVGIGSSSNRFYLRVTDAVSTEQLWADSTYERLTAAGPPSALIESLRNRVDTTAIQNLRNEVQEKFPGARIKSDATEHDTLRVQYRPITEAFIQTILTESIRQELKRMQVKKMVFDDGNGKARVITLDK
jgi:hypothetical protein